MNIIFDQVHVLCGFFCVSLQGSVCLLLPWFCRMVSFSVNNWSRLTQAEKLAVILGTEGDGLADCTIEGCDYTVKIPMAHGVDSLNVAAASAVAFWQLGGLE